MRKQWRREMLKDEDWSEIAKAEPRFGSEEVFGCLLTLGLLASLVTSIVLLAWLAVSVDQLRKDVDQVKRPPPRATMDHK